MFPDAWTTRGHRHAGGAAPTTVFGLPDGYIPTIGRLKPFVDVLFATGSFSDVPLDRGRTFGRDVHVIEVAPTIDGVIDIRVTRFGVLFDVEQLAPGEAEHDHRPHTHSPKNHHPTRHHHSRGLHNSSGRKTAKIETAVRQNPDTFDIASTCATIERPRRPLRWDPPASCTPTESPAPRSDP